MLNMKDIAAKSGVSRSTVSLILNERHGVVGISEATRQRVLAAAAELGYRRNELARSVVTGRNRVLGFLTWRPGMEAKARVLEGVLEAANHHGYLVKVLHLAENELSDETIERCLEWRLSGVIALHLQQDALLRLHQTLGAHHVPIAMPDDAPPQQWGVRIISDEEQAMQLAVEHLTELGHRHIAIISGSADSPLAQTRVRLFCTLRGKAGFVVPCDYVLYTLWDGRNPAEADILHFLQRASPRPTAIICASDFLALITLRAANSLGWRVPEELSVMGYGDFYPAQLATPALTTIAQPFEEMGRRAVHGLIERIEKDSDRPQQETLPVVLVNRGSTALCAI